MQWLKRMRQKVRQVKKIDLELNKAWQFNPKMRNGELSLEVRNGIAFINAFALTPVRDSNLAPNQAHNVARVPSGFRPQHAVSVALGNNARLTVEQTGLVTIRHSNMENLTTHDNFFASIAYPLRLPVKEK